MTNKKHPITKIASASAMLALLLGFGVTASAADVSTTANIVTPVAQAAVTAKVSAALPGVITKGDNAINVRITALNNLSARVAAMQNVSDSEKAAVATEVQTQIANLTTLKAKIDADTDVTVARADDKTITGDYRIYALVIPRGYIVASSDRVSVIVNLMTTLQAKLETRIAALQATGADVTALQAASTDMSAKMTLASTVAATAQTQVAGLSPDGGNATIAASNKATLLAARADIKTASTDLKAARKDISTITAGLKVKADASANTTTAASASAQ